MGRPVRHTAAAARTTGQLVNQHTGDVIGSVVGTKKYIYDIFGDTVNTAARFEGLSEPMSINVSRQVVDRIDPSFTYQHRGKIPVKGKGELDMYFIDWKVTEKAADV